MKHFKLIYGALVLTIATIIGCGKDADEKISELKIETNEIIIGTSLSKEIKILEGNGNYSVKIDDISVANASVKGNIITVIAGDAPEKTQTRITIVDQKKKQTSFIVKVSDLGISKDNISVEVEESSEIEISGLGDYLVAVNNTNASAKIVGNKIAITGKTPGDAIVTLTDNTTGKTKNIAVKVIERLILDQNSISINRLENNSIFITSSEDKPDDYPYSIEEGYDTNIVKSVIIQITAKGSQNGKDIYRIEITAGPKAGKTDLVVIDGKTGAKETLSVTVTNQNLTITGQIQNNTLTIKENEVSDVVGLQGSGDYSFAYSAENIVRIEKTNIVGASDKLRITAVGIGTSEITITDNNTKQTKKLTVIVTEKPKAQFTISDEGVLTDVTNIPENSEITIPKVTTIAPRFVKQPKNVIKINAPFVENIKQFAFQALTNLTEVTIGESIKNIDSFIFSNTPALKIVQINAKTPPTLKGKIIVGTKKIPTLIVPKGSKADYEAINFYKESFDSIVEAE